jgi:GNAT superfamily N-acetyltransferase
MNTSIENLGGAGKSTAGQGDAGGRSARTIDSETYHLRASTELSVARVAERLEHLTFPSLRQRIQTQRLHEPLFTVAVCRGAEPVGLALAHAAPNQKTAEMISLYVRRDHRGRGLSRPLLAGMERLLVRQGCRNVQLAYRADWPARPLLEHRLRQLGWTPPVGNLMLGKFNVPEAADVWRESPLCQMRLPEGFQIISWTEVTQTELESLAGRDSGGDSEALAPLEEPERIEPLNSLALRHRGQIIGWIVTHRLDARTIQYTRLHVDPPHQRLGRGLPLLAAAIQKQIEAGIPLGVFQVRADNPRMQQLIHRRLLTCLVTWTESRRSEKQLDSMALDDGRLTSHSNPRAARMEGNDSTLTNR